MRPTGLCLAIIFVASGAFCQSATHGSQAAAPTETAQPAAPASPETKPRVFLQSQFEDGYWLRLMNKDFDQVCPSARITISQQLADYTVLHLGGSSRWGQHFQLADKNGDLLSKTTEGGSILTGVKKMCDLIAADWSKNKGQIPAAAAETPAPAPADAAQPADAPLATELTLISTPDGADIELDGAFVGNTPSTVVLTIGDHTVRVSKKGYRPYERKLRTSGGIINIRAELESTK